MDANQLAQSLQDRKQKNMKFFERYFPSIHSFCTNRRLTELQLNLDSESLEVNLLQNGELIYPAQTQAFNSNEAQQFSDAFAPGKMNHPLRHTYANELHHFRYSHGLLAEYLESVGAHKGNARPYGFRHSLPQVVFLGSGIGQHITEFLNIRDVRHVVVVEHNPDYFMASLYVTDWEALITPYLQADDRSFVLSVGDTAELDEEKRVHNAFGGVWNHICLNVPFMPIQTVFYVHRADPFYTKVARRLNREIEPYLNVWGYYDDEVNQLNHVLHNLSKGIRVMPRPDLHDTPKITLVCGNGPSLDKYIDLIKQHRDKITILCAESAGHSLAKNDIYPDAMVILESDYITYQAVSIIPQDKSKKINIIGAAQISPLVFNHFNDGLIYLKSESSYGKLLASDDTIADATPSAGNAALAIALDLNLPDVFLVGLDFGFADPGQTHSASAFYSEEEQADMFAEFKRKMTAETYKVETNVRGDIYTTPFYFTAKTHAERKIMLSGRKDVINLSQGVTIIGTTKMTEDGMAELLSQRQEAPEFMLFDSLKNDSRKIGRKAQDKLKKEIIRTISQMCTEITAIVENMQPDLDSIESSLFKINQVAINNRDSKTAVMNTFIRGTIWFWLYNFYALSKQIESEKKLSLYTENFKQYFGFLIKTLPEHLKNYIKDCNSDDDPRLKLTISQPEPDYELWKDKVIIREMEHEQ